MNYSFHPAAEAEFLESVGYYESKVPGLGDALIAEFEALAKLIGESPKAWQVAPLCLRGRKQLVFDPSQFQINEAWIAFKLNDAPVVTEVDGDFNVLALMDAASCMILGTEFVSAGSLEPSQLESKRLLKGGYSHKLQFPKKLFIPTNQAADLLSVEAERNKIFVIRVPEEQLLIFIGEALEGFHQHVSGGRVQ